MQAEVAEVKDGGWFWDLVLLEVVIETSSRSPEVSIPGYTKLNDVYFELLVMVNSGL